MEYNKLREWLAEQEHVQWVYWSKYIAKELELIRNLACKGNTHIIQNKVNSILTRWKKSWKSYKKLSENMKDDDRIWADKIIDGLKRNKHHFWEDDEVVVKILPRKIRDVNIKIGEDEK